MITKDNKSTAISNVQKNKQDVGSAQVQVSILTARIKEITEHLQVHKQDHKARRGLIQLVGKRKKLLGYLEKKDFAGYKALITHLGLRK
jgi:small subunit ribosomal protein S15|tara:strand:- start:325 stop:591 length:267 start_codon:yes stop_codon:yes gene_type:complete